MSGKSLWRIGLFIAVWFWSWETVVPVRGGEQNVTSGCCAGKSGSPAKKTGFDFESGDLQGWSVAEGEFGRVVTDRATYHNTPQAAYNKQGRFYLTTLETKDDQPDDRYAGVLESPVFVLSEPEISFLIGGGAGKQTYAALCLLDGTEVMRVSGRNTEEMARVRWDAGEYVGQPLFITVVDQSTGPWGHVTLDDIAFTGNLDSAATEQMPKDYEDRKAVRSQQAQEQIAKLEAKRERRKVELREDAYLFSRGETRVYRGKNLSAISLPLGGIGAGCIQIDGRARRHVWQIFGNYRYAEIPDSFFAVRAREQGGKIVVRALQTAAAGPFAAMTDLAFRGEYPFGWYAFEDAELPVRVEMEVFSPMIPLNTKDSAIPCALFNLTARNPGDTPVEVSFLATQQNAVGFTDSDSVAEDRKFPGYGQNVNQVVRQEGATFLHMTTRKPADVPAFGDMVLAAAEEGAAATASWESRESLYESYESEGKLTGPEQTGPSEEGTTWNGALASSLVLEGKQQRTVTLILTWSFPNVVHGEQGWGGKGNYYNNWWPDAMAAARDVNLRREVLTAQTRLYHDSFYASNLPHWLLDRISSQAGILRTRTCFWTRDGYFGGYEGCCPAHGCCMGNCTHVWHYAQAHARLYPEIARLMRQQDFANQDNEGGLLHRHVKGMSPATDGHLGSILGAYREHLMSKDANWLKTYWPNIRRAMEYTIGMNDPDEDGVLSGMQWNTLDGSLGGSTSWMGSLYLAALSACEQMARLQGEMGLAERYRKIIDCGATKQVATLFNGEYFIQIPDASLQQEYLGGCHIDQVLGQFWSHQLHLGWVYPPDKVRSALGALMKYNFHAMFLGIEQAPRVFVAQEDAGLQMITWPKGNKPPEGHVILYGDEVMTGFEYTASAAMVHAGMLREGFSVVRSVYDRYDGRQRTDLTNSDYASWGYSGNPFGDDECGKFYARAMSVWGMLIACQGFIYNGPEAVIGFKPVWQPEEHVSFFTAAQGWGVFRQNRSAQRQTEKIEVAYGNLSLQKLIFELPMNASKLTRISVLLDGTEIFVHTDFSLVEVQILFDNPLTVPAGSVLEVYLDWR